MHIDEINIVKEVGKAVVNRNEKLLRELTILALKLFLEGKLLSEELSSIGTSPITVGIEEGWKEDFKFEDKKLKYVLEELSPLEEEQDKVAKEKIKRFILYLEGKDYEK